MKITKLFKAYLDSNQYLILPKIGKFEYVIPVNALHKEETEKRFIRFIDDKEIENDSKFLNYSTNKLQTDACIAESDLSSFCNLVNELLIQGFEAEIPGIGFLNLESKNKLSFTGKSIYKTQPHIIKKKPVEILSSSFWL